MSDEKPFAWSERGQGVWYELVVAGEYVGRHPDGRAPTLSRINSAVAARERKAAAKALREAAAVWAGYGSTDVERHNRVTEWLLSRAAALEGGAT